MVRRQHCSAVGKETATIDGDDRQPDALRALDRAGHCPHFVAPEPGMAQGEITGKRRRRLAHEPERRCFSEQRANRPSLEARPPEQTRHLGRAARLYAWLPSAHPWMKTTGGPFDPPMPYAAVRPSTVIRCQVRWSSEEATLASCQRAHFIASRVSTRDLAVVSAI
jgi:hypothetical protein